MPSRRAWMNAALTLTALITTTSSPRGDEPKIEGDLKTLQGKWTTPSGGGGNVTYTFKGKTLKIEAPTRSV